MKANTSEHTIVASAGVAMIVFTLSLLLVGCVIDRWRIELEGTVPTNSLPSIISAPIFGVESTTNVVTSSPISAVTPEREPFH